MVLSSKRDMLKKSRFFLVLLFLLSLIPLFDFFQPGLPLTHDGQDHVARIANFYQSLSEGNLAPRWAANLNWGYGHPILMFLYPLPSYLASFFHFLGFSFINSIKIVFGLSFILSGIFMYFWIKEVWGKEAGFVAALIYMFVPYRFVDLYVRGAIGECWAFIWPPLVCFFTFKLSRKFKWRYFAGGSLSLAALILSHNALSLMFLPMIFGYSVWLVYSVSKSKRKLLAFFFFVVFVFGFSLSAFFWLPALWEGKYTLRDIVTKGNITGFESFSRLLWSPWSYGGTGSLSVQVGILQWLGVILAPYLIWRFQRRKDKIWLFLLFLFICFWLAIFMMLPASKPIYFVIPLLQKFQFVWRFLSLAIFPPAVFLAALIFILPEKFKFIALCLFLIASLFLSKDYWRVKGFSFKSESFYTQAYPGTTDTGESAPRWSVRFMEDFPKAPIEVIDGKAEIEQTNRLVASHTYKIRAELPTRLVENTLYFPGWQVFVNGQPTEIQFQDPAWRGLMTFNIPEGEHQIVVRFGETKFRKFADVISLFGLFVLVSSVPVIKSKKWGRKFR